MRRFGLLAAAAMCALAQTPPASQSTGNQASLRGVLLDRDSGASGEFSVRGAANEVFRFVFDAHTQVDRAGLAAALPGIRPGEEIEVGSAAVADSPLRYARQVHAIAPEPPQPARASVRRRNASAPLPSEPLFPRGEITFSGVVSFLSGGRLVLRTRDAGEQTILLRQDTRYLAEGDIVRGSDLKANMRVFIRAGKDLFGHTEAYQVMWGGFLQPK